jgi:hypothetical protein
VERYRPIITDPEHLKSVEGHTFVVLRAMGALAQAYYRIQRQARRALAGLPVSYPNVPHVTLASSPPETDLAVLRAAVSPWAAATGPLLLQPQAVGVFPPPHGVLRMEITKTDDLGVAQAVLVNDLKERGLTELAAREGLLPVWVFHLSIAYCDQVSEDDWTARVLPLAQSLEVPAESYLCEEAEIITFKGEMERPAGRFRLSG